MHSRPWVATASPTLDGEPPLAPQCVPCSQRHPHRPHTHIMPLYTFSEQQQRPRLLRFRQARSKLVGGWPADGLGGILESVERRQVETHAARLASSLCVRRTASGRAKQASRPQENSTNIWEAWNNQIRRGRVLQADAVSRSARCRLRLCCVRRELNFVPTGLIRRANVTPNRYVRCKCVRGPRFVGQAGQLLVGGRGNECASVCEVEGGRSARMGSMQLCMNESECKTQERRTAQPASSQSGAEATTRQQLSEGLGAGWGGGGLAGNQNAG